MPGIFKELAKNPIEAPVINPEIATIVIVNPTYFVFFCLSVKLLVSIAFNCQPIMIKKIPAPNNKPIIVPNVLYIEDNEGFTKIIPVNIIIKTTIVIPIPRTQLLIGDIFVFCSLSVRRVSDKIVYIYIDIPPRSKNINITIIFNKSAILLILNILKK